MILELNATEIIACAVDKHIKSKPKSNNLSIQIGHIQRVARKMEEEMPTLLTYCDRMAIEDCQFTFRENMSMDSSYVRITQVHEIRPMVCRFLPKQEIYIKVIEKL